MKTERRNNRIRKEYAQLAEKINDNAAKQYNNYVILCDYVTFVAAVLLCKGVVITASAVSKYSTGVYMQKKSISQKKSSLVQLQSD